eukprot:CAMPEP_0119127874 /NCGR_PEP_ID=MMETSP1310-20130426/6248_1 /TAXON_ID=464262 /ORGANISM="Genus nov. species nov., Strain RCC2339" /LENGTH=368 /DNA_ID=CAMNT_0007118157 /DNA_START=59 /DNA_END=1165 /DNA_ORIENTATION=+
MRSEQVVGGIEGIVEMSKSNRLESPEPERDEDERDTEKAERGTAVVRAMEDIMLEVLDFLVQHQIPKFSHGRRGTLSSGNRTPTTSQREKQVKSLAMRMALANLAHEVAPTGSHVMKRDVYYRFPSIFSDQQECDRALEKLLRLAQIERNEFPVIPAERGFIFGPVTLVQNQDTINCMSGLGWRISPIRDAISEIQTNAKYVLVVEKFSVYQKLVQSDIVRREECVLCTGKGYPDFATRLSMPGREDNGVSFTCLTREFLVRLAPLVKNRIFVVTDCDPHVCTPAIAGSTMLILEEKLNLQEQLTTRCFKGITIFETYRKAIPLAVRIGVRLADIMCLGIPPSEGKLLIPSDRKRLRMAFLGARIYIR